MKQHKLFAQRIGLVAASNMLVSLSGIILLPIITKNLPVEDYGVWVQVGVTVELIPLAVTLGLPYALVRYLAASQSREIIQDKFYSMFFIVALSGLATSIMLYLLSQKIADLLFDGNNFAVKIASLIVFVECASIMFFNLFRASQEIKKYSLFTLVRSSLNMLIVAGFIFLGKGLNGALVGLLASNILLSGVMFFAVVHDIGLSIPHLRGMKEYLAFGIPVVPWNMSNWLINFSDRYIIGLFLGSAYVGFYSPGYVLGNIIMVFIAPFTFLLPVVLSKAYDEGNIKETKAILSHSLKYFLSIAIPSAFGLSLLSKPLLMVISTPEIASHGYLITPFVAFGGLLLGCYTIISQILVLEKAMRLIGIIWGTVAIENLILTIILTPAVGIIGAAIATLISFISAFILVFNFSFRTIRFNIDFKFITKSLAASVLMSALIVAWSPSDAQEILEMIIFGALAYAASLYALRGFTKDELVFFRSILKKG